MLYVLCPVLTMYIGHAAIVMEYKDWYTWTLAMLHGFLTSLGEFSFSHVHKEDTVDRLVIACLEIQLCTF